MISRRQSEFPRLVNTAEPWRRLTSSFIERGEFPKMGMCFIQVIARAGAWWGGPPGPHGTPSSRCRERRLGLRAGEGACPAFRSDLRLPESSTYPSSPNRSFNGVCAPARSAKRMRRLRESRPSRCTGNREGSHPRSCRTPAYRAHPIRLLEGHGCKAAPSVAPARR